MGLSEGGLICWGGGGEGAGPALVVEAATHARTIFRGKNFEFKLFLRGENIEQVQQLLFRFCGEILEDFRLVLQNMLRTM